MSSLRSAIAGISRARAYEFLRHQAAAALATVVDFLSGGLLVLAGVDATVATFAGALMGAVCNFLVARRYVFSKVDQGVTAPALRYSVVAFGSALANALLVRGAMAGGLLPFAFARPLASLIVSVAWNYPLHRHFVFGAPLAEARAETQGAQ